MSADELYGVEIDTAWRRVVEQIPSRHIRGELRQRATAYRRWLAYEATRRRKLRYLEIGVRLGHSLALVTLLAGERLEFAIGVDSWVPNYAGERNLGPDAVRNHLLELGVDIEHVSFLSGDSHELLTVLMVNYRFDLILVDGDHTPDGARQDLVEALELLAPGGMIVFDDALFDGDDALLKVWRDVVSHNPSVRAAAEELDDKPGWCWLQRSG